VIGFYSVIWQRRAWMAPPLNSSLSPKVFRVHRAVEVQHASCSMVIYNFTQFYLLNEFVLEKSYVTNRRNWNIRRCMDVLDFIGFHFQDAVSITTWVLEAANGG